MTEGKNTKKRQDKFAKKATPHKESMLDHPDKTEAKEPMVDSDAKDADMLESTSEEQQKKTAASKGKPAAKGKALP